MSCDYHQAMKAFDHQPNNFYIHCQYICVRRTMLSGLKCPSQSWSVQWYVMYNLLYHNHSMIFAWVFLCMTDHFGRRRAEVRESFERSSRGDQWVSFRPATAISSDTTQHLCREKLNSPVPRSYWHVWWSNEQAQCKQRIVFNGLVSLCLLWISIIHTIKLANNFWNDIVFSTININLLQIWILKLVTNVNCVNNVNH